MRFLPEKAVDHKSTPYKMLIYNDGRLPESWTADDLFSPHTSKPCNPLIAGAFFRSGQIEAWGRGIEKITETCKSWGKPLPFFRLRPNEVMIGFNTEPQFGEKFGVNQTQEKIMAIMRSNPAVSINAIAGEIGITTRGVEKSIRELKKAGIGWLSFRGMKPRKILAMNHYELSKSRQSSRLNVSTLTSLCPRGTLPAG